MPRIVPQSSKADNSDLVLSIHPSVPVSLSKDERPSHSYSSSILTFSLPCHDSSYSKTNPDSSTKEEDESFMSLPTVYGGPMMWLKRRALLLAETPSTFSVSTTEPCSLASKSSTVSLSYERSELATILETNEDLSVHSFCTMIESSSYSYRSVSYSSISESDVSVLCYDDEEFSHVQVSDTCQQNLILDESLPSVPATIQPFADSQCNLNCSLPSTAVTSAPMCDPTLLSYRRNIAELERSHCCTFM